MMYILFILNTIVATWSAYGHHWHWVVLNGLTAIYLIADIHADRVRK